MQPFIHSKWRQTQLLKHTVAGAFPECTFFYRSTILRLGHLKCITATDTSAINKDVTYNHIYETPTTAQT